MSLDAFLGSALAAKGPTFFMPPQSSTVAAQIDRVFDLVFWISAFFFVLIVAVMLYFMVKYRHRPGHVESKTSSHNDILEVTWSVIPALLTVVIFVEGVNSYLNLRQPPPDCYEIDAIGKKWNWTFVYPNGVATSELHFPIGRPVKIVVSSDDVLHALYVPDFRVKMDAVPGRYTYLWFQVNEPNTALDAEGKRIGHRVYCAEYCGKSHSNMKTWAFADTPEQFEAWLIDEANYVEKYDDPVEAGAEVFRRRGCGQCHSTEPNKVIVGPSFYGIFGEEEETSAGRVVVDQNYIRESILQPGVKVRTGFKNQMPSFQGIVSDAEINALIAFIKSKNPNYKGADVTPETTEGEPATGTEGAAAEGGAKAKPPVDPTTTTADTPAATGETANPESPPATTEPEEESAAPAATPNP